MIDRFRIWLRLWLGITPEQQLLDRETAIWREIGMLVKVRELDIARERISKLENELARLSIAQYVPPSQSEPERKIIQTTRFKQYLDIIEKEEAAQEAREDAIR